MNNTLEEIILGGINAAVCGKSTTTMSGFPVVEAESLDAAIAMAKACPFLKVNGSLEVSEMIKMPG